MLRYIPGPNEYDFYHGAKIVIFGEKDKRGVLSGEMGVWSWEMGDGSGEWGVWSFKFQVSSLASLRSASPRVKFSFAKFGFG